MRRSCTRLLSLSFAPLLLVLTLPLSAVMADAEPAAAAGPAARLMSGEAWADYCDRIKAMGQLILSDEFPGSERERAEGFRHLARTVAMGLQWEIDVADPDFPAFYRQNDEHTKWGGPNVDNTYLRARIDGSSTYELRGNISTIEDLIISTADGDMHQGKTGVQGDFDRSQLAVDAAGNFTLQIGPAVDPKRGIRTPPEAVRLEIRQYFKDWERETPATFHLRRTSDGPSLPAQLTPAVMAERLDAAARWVEQSIPMWNGFMLRQAKAGPANTLSAPQSVPGGSEDIAYGGGWFELDDDQALIIEMQQPKARLWSVQYYSFGWFESPDFANRQTSLNNSQARVDPDGFVRIVISKRDPGVQNWIDTEGRRSGALTYRWIWTDDKPVPKTRVVTFSQVRSQLHAQTPAFGAEARQAQIRVRREHVERRFRR